MKYLLALVLIVMLILPVSCGVSQEAYDEAANELALLNANYDRVSNDLQVKAAELEFLDAKCSAANDSLAEAVYKLCRLKLEIEIYNAIFIPALTGELGNASEAEQQQIINAMEEKIEALGDPVMHRKYKQMKFSGDTEATAEFFIYLLKDMEMTLK